MNVKKLFKVKVKERESQLRKKNKRFCYFIIY